MHSAMIFVRGEEGVQFESITPMVSHIDRVKVSRPTRHKIGHFGDVLPIQSLGLALKSNTTEVK